MTILYTSLDRNLTICLIMLRLLPSSKNIFYLFLSGTGISLWRSIHRRLNFFQFIGTDILCRHRSRWMVLTYLTVLLFVSWDWLSEMKFDLLFLSKRYLTPDTILYMYTSTVHSCIECWCIIQTGSPENCLTLLHRKYYETWSTF